MTQQALSKRIRRLEDSMGVLLFVRSTRVVSLSEAGRRFLPLARDLLATADKAASIVQRRDDPLRIDVMQEHLAPTSLIRVALEADPDLRIEVSARRGLDRSVPAMLRDEIDMAFGRLYDHGVRLGEEFGHELVRLEPMMALVRNDHPAAEQSTIPLSELSRWGLWTPSPGTPAEWSAFLRDLVEAFNAQISFENVAGTDITQILELARPRRDAVFVTGADVANPVGPGHRLVPLSSPVPVYPWSVMWRRHDKHPQVRRFLDTLRRLRSTHHWCAFDGTHWMPEADLAGYREWVATTGARTSPTAR
jgi:DNA-binding transcriptional LysR family regulator